MAILKVAHLGHPVVRKVAAKVDPAALTGADMQRFLDDMVETMREYEGIGLAAPQVHVLQQIAVIDGALLDDEPDVPEVARGLFFLVNPVLHTPKQRRFQMWEGCLSVPGFRGKVPRIKELEVEAWDRHGKPLRFAAKGYFAGVVQHEVDHLSGKVYLDRMQDLSTLAYLKEYRRYYDKESAALDEIVES
jgi:peptide deformylase